MYLLWDISAIAESSIGQHWARAPFLSLFSTILEDNVVLWSFEIRGLLAFEYWT